MATDAELLRAALVTFGSDGTFTEESYSVLKRLVATSRVSWSVTDGFVALFFERHVLVDARRAELVVMADEELVPAIRHRFRQVVAGASDDHAAWHALSAHVRDALRSLRGPGSGFPALISTASGFSSIAVEQAVAAFWGELGAKPTAREAAAELMSRYVKGEGNSAGESSHDFPAIIIAKMDAQRLASGILDLLSDDERELLRNQIDGASIEEWARGKGISRATAFRMLARVKALCRTEFEQRTNRTQLEVLDVLRERL